MYRTHYHSDSIF